MSDDSRPVILGPEHIHRAVADDRFFSLMPEFAGVRAKMDAAAAPRTFGCGSCRRKRVAMSMSADFMSVVGRLSDDGLKRLKSYLGVERLLVRMLDRSTGRVVMREV